MSTKESRDVLDWFRQWSVGKLDAIGRTDLTSNMNLPLTSDQRVQAGIDYMAGIEADVWALYNAATDEERATLWDPQWESIQDSGWADIEATMPADVTAGWDALWADPDLNVKRFLKGLMRATLMLLLANAAAAGA